MIIVSSRALFIRQTDERTNERTNGRRFAFTGRKIIDRRKSDDVQLAKVNEDEDETVPVEQVKCLVLKDDVEDENEESSAGKDEEERK